MVQWAWKFIKFERGSVYEDGGSVEIFIALDSASAVFADRFPWEGVSPFG